MKFTRSILQRTAIIQGTTLLPRAARVRARYRLLAAWHMKMARRADVYFVRHPKTGGTWLRVMMAQLYAEKYGVSPRWIFRYDELQKQVATLPRFLTTSGYLSWERKFGDIVATDPELRRKKLIFMPRHPCDVAVSWYRQFTKRQSVHKRELLLAEMEQPIDHETIGMWDFIMHPEIGLPAIIDYHNFWQDNVSRMEHTLVVRYEDLRRDTPAELKKVMSFIGEEVPDAMIERATEFASMENLRRLERSNYFDTRNLKLRDPSDPDTLKVRRGKLGGYRDDVTPEQADQMERMVQTRLSPALGYAAETSESVSTARSEASR